MKTVDTGVLKKYLLGVLSRADHHANAVQNIVLPLCGALVMARDDDKPFEIRAQDGKLKNVLWVWINNKRYAFAYNHATLQIEMREGGIQGNVLHSFNNNDSVEDIRYLFEELMGLRPTSAAA